MTELVRLRYIKIHTLLDIYIYNLYAPKEKI